jgi:FtsP/CotA-like multicopper oxidase with cupredoxin domain
MAEHWANPFCELTEHGWNNGQFRTDMEQYNLDIGHENLAPDGVPKRMMVVNGQYPGPTIEADWGDNVEVRVCNHLPSNGTGIHFHGIRQLNTNYADGTTSQTECPIAPGDCHTYRWKATQHGSSWYHSHYSLQYGDGVLGSIVIHGPNTADWDVDLGPLLLTDYYHNSVFELAEQVTTKALAVPPVADNGLINGQNTYKTGGKRHQLTFKPGKKHLLRLVNTGSEVTFRFGIDKHKLTVVAMDFVPIQPFETRTLLLAIGQRYDVIVEADQSPDTAGYWARAVPMMSCLSINTQAHDIRAVVRYDATPNKSPHASSASSLPTSKGWPMLDTCKDKDLANLKPWIAHTVGPSAVTKAFDAKLLNFANNSLALRWQVGGVPPSPYKPLKGNPVVKQILDSDDNIVAEISMDLVPAMDLRALNNRKEWVYVVIESLLPLPHPIHLHGHDSYVLARGGGLYLPGLVEVRTDNPPRRDTVNLPQNVFVVLAFETDNPGAWLLHCHIEWHLHDGFAMSVIEGSGDAIAELYRRAGEDDETRRVCRNWARSGLETRE